MNRHRPHAIVVLLAVATPLVLASARAHAEAPRPSAKQVSENREGNCQNPLWSRDGKSLAYERVFISERKIELNTIKNLDQGLEDRIVPKIQAAVGKGSWTQRFKAEATDEEEIAPGQVCHNFAWGPVQAADTYAYACNAGTYQLFWSGGGQITRGTGASGQPAWSPKGWRLAFVSVREGRRGDLFLLDDLMNNPDPKPTRLLPPSAGLNLMPTWSPSGDSLAYIKHADDGDDIYVIEDVKRPKETVYRLTSLPGVELNPSWSPDGARIAFFAYAQTTKTKQKKPTDFSHDLYVVEAKKGSKPVRLASKIAASERHGPAWTPDGKWVIAVQHNLVRLDPLVAFPLSRTSKWKKGLTLGTDTVSNADPDITTRSSKWSMAFTALGHEANKDRTWRKVYVYSLERLREKFAP